MKSLKTKVFEITGENERLWYELSKINLIFSGISERSNETQNDLFAQVSNVIQESAGVKYNLDTAYRIGKPSSKFARPIKVSFLSLFERNEVYAGKFKVNKPTFINEDLPLSVRKDHSILRQKRKQLIEQGFTLKQIRIDWTRQTINTGESCYRILNGNLVEIYQKANTMPSTQSYQPDNQGNHKATAENIRSSVQPKGSQAPEVDQLNSQIVCHETRPSVPSRPHSLGNLRNIDLRKGIVDSVGISTNHTNTTSESPMDDFQDCSSSQEHDKSFDFSG